MSGPRRRKFVSSTVSRATWHAGRGRQRSRWALIIVLARAVGPPAILEVPPPQALVAAEQDVLGHVRREAARGRPAAQRLGEAPDVMLARAAADTEIADVERERVLPELGDLVTVAEERIERGGEGAVAGKGRVRQALEDRLRRRRPVGNRQRGHVTRHGGTNLPEQRQRRRWSPGAVEADDGGAARFEAATGIGHVPALPRGAVARDGQRDHGGAAGLPDRLEGEKGLASERVRLGHDEVDAGL